MCRRPKADHSIWKFIEDEKLDTSAEYRNSHHDECKSETMRVSQWPRWVLDDGGVWWWKEEVEEEDAKWWGDASSLGDG